jgi:hypothetical protein
MDTENVDALEERKVWTLFTSDASAAGARLACPVGAQLQQQAVDGLLGRRTSEDLDEVRSARAVDSVTRAEFGVTRVEDVLAMTG